jgi:hypothetical protein
MKTTSKFMKRSTISVLSLVTLVTMALFINSCQKDSADLTENGSSSSTPMKIVTINNEYAQGCVYIFAGQNINVGSMCLNDIDTDSDGTDDALQVCLTTTGCWEINGVASWFGGSTAMPPMNKAGQPVPGHFPYQSGTLATQSYCFNIPFSSFGFSCPGNTINLRGAVHLNVRNTCNNTTQTGWAAGDRIAAKGNWGTFFGFNITCDEELPPPSNNCHETAFGQDNSASLCFTDPIIDALVGGADINRWGWSNGIYSGDGSHTLTLRAGAAHCSGGTNVGTVTFSRTGSTITVTYTVVSPYWLGLIHFYAGNDRLYYECNGPCGYTVAPGQFPYISATLDPSTTTHTFTYPASVSGDYYVVAHAAVYGFPCLN